MHRFYSSLAILLTLSLAVASANAQTVGYWRFETGPAGNHVAKGFGAIDVSGNGNHMDPWDEGGAGFFYRTDVPDPYVPQTAQDNNLSIKNSGGWPGMNTDSAQTSPDGVDIETWSPATWTLEAAFKPEDGGYRTIVGRDSRGTANHNGDLAALYLQITPEDALAIKFCDVTGNWHEAISENGLIAGFVWGNDPDGVNGTWYYAAATSDGDTLSLYVAQPGQDYVLVATDDISASPDSAMTVGAGSGGDWHAGAWTIGRGMYAGGHEDRGFGYIDEVRATEGALAVNQFLAYGKHRAHNPQPANQATKAPIDVNLSWSAPLDNSGLANTRLASYQLYLQKSPTDPNWAAPVTVPAADPAQYGPIAIGYDIKDYRWRVDAVINDPDPNTFAGPVWTFSTLQSVPVVTTDPENVLVAPGETASFTVAADSVSTPHYQWKKVNPDAEDLNVGTDSDTLTISDAAVADEGFYYCVVSNASSGSATTAQASLTVTRVLAHYPLDGDFNDASGNNHHADPNGLATFVDGIDAGGALQVNANGWANAGTWNPAQFSGQVTVSAWVNYNGGQISGDGQGIVSKRAASGNDMHWSIYARPGDGGHSGNNWLRGTSWNGGDIWAGPNAYPQDQWAHVVLTAQAGGTARIYLNGLSAGTESSWAFGNNPDAPILIGAGWPDGLLFPGAIDDVRIFNYALSDLEVARLFTDITGESICVESARPSAIRDFNGDCIVDLRDFASFAQAWLACGLLPDCVQ